MLLSAAAMAGGGFPGVADTPFLQEYRTEVPYPRDAGAGGVRAVAVSGDGAVWIASKAGVYRHQKGAWQRMKTGSTYALVARGGDVWAGAWDGLYRISGGQSEKIAGVGAPVVALWADAQGVVAAGQTFMAEWGGKGWTSKPWKGARSVRSIAREASGGWWIATGMGGYYR